jgi:hypothetical protein
MASPLRRLPEALIAVVFSALELREHCAFRHCARFFAEIAHRPTASPHLLRIRAEPRSIPTKKRRPAKNMRPPSHQEARAKWHAKREAETRVRAPWDGLDASRRVGRLAGGARLTAAEN